MAVDHDTEGQGRPRVAVALAVLGPVLAAALNVWTRVHDQPELAAGDRLWEPIVWEASGAVATLALLPLIWRAVLTVERNGSRPAVALGSSLAFASGFYLLHVATFVLLRSGAYRLVGQSYRFGGIRSWVYELPKDLLTFVILAGILLAGRRLARPASPVAAEPTRPEPLRIKDGSRTFLVAPDEILAASASGNYVEYHLRDGRRPLSRSRFGEAEALLGPLGFVRTHRSWLANRAHVREVRPVGNGDHELVVGTDLKVPVSRRFAAQVLPDLR